ncbi:MFS transporter [Scytonema sp. PCC 10023]|uniref:MFS transporter n=1 Tax=Scytonema sp. PCC 10023 TaxID=1680591 RepID=UPI0039C6BD39
MATSQWSSSSAWSPLKLSIFRALWLALLASNIGLWMQNVEPAWLMTSLSSFPLLMALLQAATSLPIFLVGFPAGANVDIHPEDSQKFVQAMDRLTHILHLPV